MSTSKHTPVKLVQYGRARVCVGSDPDGRDWMIFLVDADARTVARVHGATQEEAEANAAYIVRACNAHEDLVASLKDLLGPPSSDMVRGAESVVCRHCGREYGLDDAPKDATECADGTIEDGACPGYCARAALAKATSADPTKTKKERG